MKIKCDYTNNLYIIFTLIVSMMLLTQIVSLSDTEDEQFRIKILNSNTGFVQISIDKGETYTSIGSVVNPATKIADGFIASKYMQTGKITAVAVHGIRIKTDEIAGKEISKIFSIIPKEFSQTPKRYGGHIAGQSGIFTDIPAGHAIFRNLSPFVGNDVYLQQKDKLILLPKGYIPALNDTIVIIVKYHTHPEEIIFDNTVNGNVEAIYSEHNEIIGKVVSPVSGIGRFDATGYTGIGAINTNHPGVITISTTPLNGGEMGSSKNETRGGFQIVPSIHAKTLDIAPQLLVIGPTDGNEYIEGKAPLFLGCIGLAFDDKNIDKRFYMQMRSESSDWVSLPSIAGKNDDFLSKILISDKPVRYFKLHFPTYNSKWINEQLDKSAIEYMQRSRKRAEENNAIVTGDYFNVNIEYNNAKNASHATLYIDNELRGITNTYPYEFNISLNNITTGDHIAELNITDRNGIIQKKKYYNFYKD